VNRAFSLIELIIVLAIMMAAAALIMGTPKGDRRLVPVQQAARELAQTFRQARALAIEQQAPVSVTFNVQNAPGSSGKVLNNWNGGHWYRLISSFPWISGPASAGLLGVTGPPRGTMARRLNKLLDDWGADRDTPASTAVDKVRSCAIGDRRVLPARKVRFLALTDQDNGGAQFRDSGDGPEPDTPLTLWGVGYPRPWFGAWDPASRRLLAWGGYDHTVPLVSSGHYASKPRTAGGQPMSPSGFWYEGHDGEITGCVHPKDRWIISDVQGNDGAWLRNAGDSRMPQDAPYTFDNRFFTAGDPRPLVNGEWMDCAIEFHPDGTVRQAVWGGLRMAYAHGANWSSSFWFAPDFSSAPATTGAKPGAGPPWDLTNLGPGDMCPVQVAGTWTRAYNNHVPPCNENASREACDDSAWALPASRYVERTGWMWITLAPDAEQDGDVFSDAWAAWRAVMPAIRVGVSRYGEVKVVQLSPVMPAAVAEAYELDPELRGAAWDNAAVLRPRYRRAMRSDTAGRPLGVPAEEFLTPEMLQERAWWLIPK